MDPQLTTQQNFDLGDPRKNRDEFLRILRDCIQKCKIEVSRKVLVVGGSFQDVSVLRSAGFKNITLSNLQTVPSSVRPAYNDISVTILCDDAEEMGLADNTYHLVIAHEVLHHCRSPHKVLCEMLRVSGQYVVILEPNDSFLMTLLVALRFSFPYELPAVIYHNYEAGGVRDSVIPNFVYRWNRNDVFKTVSSFVPEGVFSLHVYPYWDFNADEMDLALRKQTKIRALTRPFGPRNFLRGLRFMQLIFNRIPPIRRQGNKFFCCIEKQAGLKPWLVWKGGRVTYNRNFDA